MHVFDKIPPDNLAILAALLGVILSSSLRLEEQNVIGNFMLSIGQTILTKSAQGENLKAIAEREDMKSKIDDMSKQLESMKKQIGK